MERLLATMSYHVDSLSIHWITNLDNKPTGENIEDFFYVLQGIQIK